jgi:Ca2+-binding RTX toxin-like protein
MSFHFLNGTISGAYADTGPGKIIVDRGASINTNNAATDALSLSSGPWTIIIDGAVGASFGDAIDLGGVGAFVSNVTLGKHAVLTSPNMFGIGINASHATNIINAGTVTGVLAGIGETGDGNFRIENLKSGGIGGGIYGIVVESLGTHNIINAGNISGPTAIRSWSGIEKVTNFGTLDGDVDLGGGNDTLTNFKKVGKIVKQGSVTGTIDLGAGDDRFNGGNRAETVKDGDGRDIIKLGGGNDVWKGYLEGGHDLTDTIDGGKGIDTYDASGAGSELIAVNLGGDFPLFPGQTAFSFIGGTDYAETIVGFENAIGSAGQDALIGNGGVNTLKGSGGEDTLVGRGGVDHLYGGADADSFYFLSLKDSGPKAATRDTIHDFEVGVDHIGLYDLNDRLGGIITDFLGVDVAFTGHKGDLRAVTSGDNTIVQLDVNGDKKADFSIQLDGHHALTVDDFNL